MEIREIIQLLNDRAEDVAAMLLPGGKREGREWVAGSVAGEAGRSCKVAIEGSKRGKFADFAGNESGDLLDLWQLAKGITVAEAVAEAKKYLGIHEPKFEKFSEKSFRKPTPPKSAKKLIDGGSVQQYLFSRGLSPESLSAYRIGEIAEIGPYPGWKSQNAIKGAFVLFPSFRDTVLVAVKYLHIKRKDGKKFTLVEPNCEAILFGWQAIPDNARSVILTEGEIDAITYHSYGFPALRTIPAIVEQSARPILEWLVPRQKFGVFAEMANEWSQRNPNASHEATRKAMQQIWNRVDSRLGQVVYDRLFVHAIAKNLTQALLRAPGWTGGTILEVGGGIKDLATYAKDLSTKGKQAELSDRAAYTLSLLLITAVSNAVLTAAFTGEPPQDWKDLLAFRTGKKDEKGNPERFMLPTYAKDLYAYAQKPGTTLLHKTHPLISLIGDLAANKDYYGTEIRHEGDNPIIQVMQAGKFTAKSFVPFWMKGAAKEFERGGSIGSMAAPLIGIMPAPADLNKTEAERLASHFAAARMPKGTKTQEQFERSQLAQHLTGLARRDKTQAHQEVREALKDKKITILQARHVFQNAGLAPIQIAFKRLSFEEAEQVFEVATNEEKKKLRFMLMQKRNRHLKAA